MVDMYQIHVNVHSLLHLYDFLRKALAWDGLGWGMVCNNRDTLIRPTPKRGYSAPATKGLTSINRLWPRTIGQIFHIEGLGWITDLPCRSLKESGGGRGTPWTWQKHGVFG